MDSYKAIKAYDLTNVFGNRYRLNSKPHTCMYWHLFHLSTYWLEEIALCDIAAFCTFSYFRNLFYFFQV